MAKFIILTGSRNTGKVRINIDYIQSYGSTNNSKLKGSTFVQVGEVCEDSGFFVDETPEEIDKAIDWLSGRR
jgi:hypothetical protein